jgi:hypothetical protein
MPFTTLCALVGGLGLAALPPSLGFAAAWTLVQALIGAARLGGLGWQALATLATLVAALTGTLGAVAAVRLLGVGFLGRPRTPRAAAAQESARPVRGAMLVLAGLSLLAGVFPGLLLALAEPALRRLLGVGMADRAGLFTISPVPEAPGLAAAGVAALLVLATIATHRALRLRASVGHHAGAVWEGGAAPPPPWLPFGDPATQIGPAAFAEPLGNVLATARPAAVSRLRPMLRRWRQAVDRADAALRPSARGALAALLATVVVVLLAVVLADRP